MFWLCFGSSIIIISIIDPSVPDPIHMDGAAKINLKGLKNFIFLGAAIALIIIESMITSKPQVTLLGISMNLAALARDSLLFSLAIASWKLTPATIHEANRFTWEPLSLSLIHI